MPIEIRLGEAEPDTLRAIGGSRSDRFNNALIDAMVKTGWFPPGQSDEDRSRQLFVAVTGLRAFKPADEIEGMIAAQAMAAHHASMECSRRAMLADQPFEAAQGLRKAAANASRTFVELLSALDRKRGKGGQQVVRVEHVHVHPGGQAIVGNVATGGRGGGGAHEMPGRTPCAAGQLAHSPAPWRSPAPAAARGRGAGDRAGRRRCRTAAAGCTAEAAPGLRQRKGWRGSGRRGRSMGGYSAENCHVAAMIRVLKAEAKRLVELT